VILEIVVMAPTAVARDATRVEGDADPPLPMLGTDWRRLAERGPKGFNGSI
jgi:hypothetical protein